MACWVLFLQSQLSDVISVCEPDSRCGDLSSAVSADSAVLLPTSCTPCLSSFGLENVPNDILYVMASTSDPSISGRMMRMVEGKSSGNTRKSWQDIHRERCCEAVLVTSNSLVNYSPFLVLLWIFILIICKSSGKSAMGRKWDTNNETCDTLSSKQCTTQGTAASHSHLIIIQSLK